jgi:hypothetical protein
MASNVTVEAAKEQDLPALPPTLEIRAKKFFKDTGGTAQITMGRKPNYIHSYLYGPHNEVHMVFKMPKRSRKGVAAAKALLATLQKGISVFGNEFHVRHLLPRFSQYYTMTIIEEEHWAKANMTEVGHIRALMDLANITTYDLSARTGQLREMLARESISTPSNRYLNE